MTFFANEKKGLKRISIIVGSLSKRLNTIMSACSSDPLPLSPGSDYASERFPPHDPPPRHLPLTQLLMSTVRLRRVTFLKEKKMKISSWVWIRFPCFQGRLFFHSRNVVRGAYGSICAGFVEGFPSQSFVNHEAPTSGNFLMNCGKATALHSTLVSLYFGRSAWHL